ncbi:MAG: penicillin-binding protein 1C, partial [Lautropia sp.]|nr:penicillin-binding protein 1C [Lautropia sp.]
RVSFKEVRARFISSETLLLDRHGDPIHRLRTFMSARRGQWVPLASIPAVLRQALLLSEDRRFYEHGGVDWQAIPAAAWSKLWHGRTRGASTLTMQLAGLLDEKLQPASGQHRRWSQKLDQALAARALEEHWQKDEILEAYLNLVPFRGELIGVDALTRSLFGKAPHGIDEQEAALTAALVRAPNAPSHRVADRACGVLRQLRPDADCADLRVLADFVLSTPRQWASSEGLAPHLTRRLLNNTASPLETPESPDAPAAQAPGSLGGRHPLHSTLDARIQRLAVLYLHQQLRALEREQVEDGAVVVLDNRLGEVLAWVGSSGELSRAADVDGVTARRQPGSALKPFLYAQAIAERRLTAGSLLNDAPTQLPTAHGLYIPRNHDRRFRGWVSARTALASSLNIPAVRTLVMVSPDAFHHQLTRLGVPLPESGGYYGYSLALGSAEVSLLQLANAYRTLANGGWHCPVRLQPSSPTRPRSASLTPRQYQIRQRQQPSGPAPALQQQQHEQEQPDAPPPSPACHRALDTRAAFIVGDILSDRQARSGTFGADSVLNTRFWTAVKTGTSKDMRDNWAIGWSQHYTVAVWVGNAGGQPMHQVSGASGAAPVWRRLMDELHRHTPSVAPSPPKGVSSLQIRFGPSAAGAGPVEPERAEWFLAGTAQSRFDLPASTLPPPAGTQRQPTHRAWITAPAPGTIIALDPDIPPAHQRLSLRARLDPASSGVPPAGLHWQIDDQRLGSGTAQGWLPMPGHHRIQLRDGNGLVLDEVRIEVRGAGLHNTL